MIKGRLDRMLEVVGICSRFRTTPARSANESMASDFDLSSFTLCNSGFALCECEEQKKQASAMTSDRFDTIGEMRS
jgi:hypothetical protein